MKNKEIRELSIEELMERISTEKLKYEKMLLNHKVSHLDKPSTLTDQRRFVARLRTILGEKKNNQ